MSAGGKFEMTADDVYFEVAPVDGGQPGDVLLSASDGGYCETLLARIPAGQAVALANAILAIQSKPEPRVLTGEDECPPIGTRLRDCEGAVWLVRSAGSLVVVESPAGSDLGVRGLWRNMSRTYSPWTEVLL